MTHFISFETRFCVHNNGSVNSYEKYSDAPASPGATYSWGVYGRFVDGAFLLMDHFTDFTHEADAKAMVKKLQDGQRAIADTAMSVWEYVLDNLTDSKIHAWRGLNGVAECRSQAYELAIEIETIWLFLPEDARDSQGSFDWEFVPLIFERYVTFEPKLELTMPVHEIVQALS